MTETPVTAITLTDAERAAILTYWESPEAFAQWQRDALAEEIEKRAAAVGQQVANEAVRAAVQDAYAQFPTVFGEPTLFPSSEQP